MKIRHPVRIYVILTENLRIAMLQELTKQLKSMERDLDEIAWRKKQMDNLPGNEAELEKDKLYAEQKRIQDLRLKNLQRQKEVAELPLGTELPHSTVEAEIDLQVGDIYEERINPQIILEDGRIVAIRNSERREV